MCGVTGFQINDVEGNEKKNLNKITEKIFHRGR